MGKYKKRGPKVGLKNIKPGQLVGHEDEKFTDLAIAFRSQIGRLLHPGGLPESLKRTNVKQLLSVHEFLHSPAEKYLERAQIISISWQSLTWRFAEANDAWQAECLEDVERWRRDYAEDASLDMEVPGWALMLGAA